MATTLQIQSSDASVQLTSSSQIMLTDRRFAQSDQDIFDPQKLTTLDWRPASSDAIYIGNTAKPHWVKMTLTNSGSAQQAVVNIGWQYLENVELVLYDSFTQQVIDQQAINQWHLDKSYDAITFSFHTDIPTTTQLTLYLRVQSPQKLVVPVSIYTQDEFADMAFSRNILLGAFFGLMVGLLLYNFFLAVFTRSASYALYCFYVTSIIIYTLETTGLGAAWVWRDIAWFNYYALDTTSALAFLCASIFIRFFIQIPKFGGVPLITSNITIITWVVLFILSLFKTDNEFQHVFDFTALISPLIGGGLVAYLGYKGSLSAKFMTLAWTPLLVSTFWLMLNWMGIFDFPLQATQLQNLTFVFEIIVLSIATAERFKAERSARKSAEQSSEFYYRELICAQQREVQTQEKLLASERRSNAELTRRVRERTKELDKANEALKLVNQELELLSTTDELTGLYNRRCFRVTFDREWKRAMRQQTPLAIIFGDIDFFKKLNDKFGHQVGDEALRYTADVWKNTFPRSEDLVARYGGEEFVAILPNTAFADAVRLAEKIRVEVANIAFSASASDEEVTFTTSIGVAVGIPQKHLAAASVIELADVALYEGKSTGRNKVVSKRF